MVRKFILKTFKAMKLNRIFLLKKSFNYFWLRLKNCLLTTILFAHEIQTRHIQYTFSLFNVSNMNYISIKGAERIKNCLRMKTPLLHIVIISLRRETNNLTRSNNTQGTPDQRKHAKKRSFPLICTAEKLCII